MFTPVLKLKPRLGKQQEMIDLLSAVEDQIRLKCWCIDCAVFAPSLEEGSILYMDQWSSKEDLCLHIQSPLFHWVLTAMELACEPPEIHFHEITNSQGLELVEALRIVRS
jgi:quinol monooxygenase YgiN